MGRDLSFWKLENNPLDSNKEIYTKLSEGEYLDFIADLPVEQILQDIKNALQGWEKISEQDFIQGESMIQLFTTIQFVRVDCYSVSEIHMNKIIDVLIKYDCPLYDSLIDVRFDEY